MKKIFCSRCDSEIALPGEKLQRALSEDEGRLSVVCPSCGKELRIRVKRGLAKEAPRPSLTMIENAFGYKQYFLLEEGTSSIGRRNKDTEQDISVITSDPSMDRHHALLRVKHPCSGSWQTTLEDDDSMTGVFLRGEELHKGERRRLEDGDVFTLGATSFIYNEPKEN